MFNYQRVGLDAVESPLTEWYRTVSTKEWSLHGITKPSCYQNIILLKELFWNRVNMGPSGTHVKIQKIKNHEIQHGPSPASHFWGSLTFSFAPANPYVESNQLCQTTGAILGDRQHRRIRQRTTPSEIKGLQCSWHMAAMKNGGCELLGLFSRENLWKTWGFKVLLNKPRILYYWTWCSNPITKQFFKSWPFDEATLFSEEF